jgi:hypothetical protein
MPEQDKRRKELYYKRAVFTYPMSGRTLQDALGDALKAKSKWHDRQDNPSGDERTFCFLNYTGLHTHDKHSQQLLGCELFSYVKGADQSTFNVDISSDTVDVSKIPPGKDREFLEGTVYFGVFLDHVIVMQSSALRFGDLERHLNWFLARHAKVIDEGDGLALMDAIPVGGREMYGDAKGITLSAPVQFDATEPSESKSKTVRLQPKGPGWNALKAMLGEVFDLPNYLNADDIFTSRSLQVQLQLKWKRAPDDDTSDLLASIAHHLRNVTDEMDYSIETKTGRVTRDEFKLHKTLTVEWIDGRPRFDILFPGMIEYLVTLAKTGKVTV